MALVRNIYGWEVGADYGATIIGNLTLSDRYLLSSALAATGCYCGQCEKTTNDIFLVGTTPVGPYVNQTITSKALLRCRFQIVTAPDAGDCGVMSIGTQPQAGNGSYALLQVNTSQKWRIGMRAGSVSAYSTFALALATWYIAEIELTLTQTWDGFSTTNIEQVTCTVNGQTLAAGPIVSVGNFGSGFTHAVVGFLGFPAWYSFGPQPTVGVFRFDDLTSILASAADLPSAVFPVPTRVRLMGVTGQGSVAEWAGSAADLTEIPVVPADPGQSSTTLGQTTLLAHAPVATIGTPSLGAISTEVVKVYGYLSTTGSPLQTMRIDATDYPVDVSASLAGGSATPFAIAWRFPGEPYTADELDALEFGWQNATGATLACPAIHAEILCELEDWVEPGCGLALPPGCADDWGHPSELPYVPLLTTPEPPPDPQPCDDDWGIPQEDGLPYVPFQ